VRQQDKEIMEEKRRERRRSVGKGYVIPGTLQKVM
jgi:hypothetical protein